MKTLIILCILLQVLHAEKNWIPHTNSAKEGDDPAYGSKTYPLADLLFNIPKSSSGWLPKNASVVSATSKQLGVYKGRKIIQANLVLSNRGYSELLLILCSHGKGFKVVLASFQSRGSQYFEILSTKKVDDRFVIKTRYSIPGTDPYSSTGAISIMEEAGNLFIR